MRLVKKEAFEHTVYCEKCDQPTKQTYALVGQLGTPWHLCGNCWRDARIVYGLTEDIEDEREGA